MFSTPNGKYLTLNGILFKFAGRSFFKSFNAIKFSSKKFKPGIVVGQSNQYSTFFRQPKPIVDIALKWPENSRRTNFKSTFSTCSILGAKTEKFILPDIGEGIKEVTIKEWQVNLGDKVHEFDPICEVESDKATVSISSRFTGKITKIYHELGSIAQVGQPLVDIELSETGDKYSNVKQNETQIDKQSSTEEKQPATRKVSMSTCEQSIGLIDRSINIATLPSVRRLAKENNIDLTQVKPTGKLNRILKEDVINFLANKSADAATNQTPRTQQSSNNSTRVPMRTVQKAMYKTMTASLQIPHFNYGDEIDMTRLMDYISEQKQSSKNSPSSFAFLIKMVSLALLEYPELNASIDADGEHLVHKHYHNIGIAVDTKHGLIVPNIKNVESKSVTSINEQVMRLRELAYNSKLSPHDLSDGTISLSNIGAIGGVFGIPVIVRPEIIIVALGRTRSLPRFNNQGQIEARKIMQVVWSADHRVVDGATLSRFSNLLKHFLEKPESAIERLS